MASDPFTVNVCQSGGIHIASLSGELDLATCEGLPDTLADLGSTVVVDLHGLFFVDSSGLSALIVARQRAEERGFSLVLTRPRDRVRMTLEIVGLADWIVPWSPPWEQPPGA